MTLCVKIPIKKTQEVKEFLMTKGLIDQRYKPKKEKEHIIITIKKKGVKKEFKYVSYENANVEVKKEKGGIKKRLEGKLTKEEMKRIQRAYDIVGSIAIIEIPKGLERKEKLIAETIFNINKNIKTVLKKAGIHSDEFRTIPLRWVTGKKTKETTAKENKVQLKLNVEKVYYSPRSSNERKRIMELIKPEEEVLVMFSGCGPFTCVIAKNTPAKMVVGVEKNPIGHEYEKENIKLNRLKNAKAILGDVRDMVPKLGRFDRILMPLPMIAEEFLDLALKAIKKGGTIHLYQFINWEEKDKLRKKVRDICAREGKRCRILRIVKSGQFSPKTSRVCVDIKVQ